MAASSLTEVRWACKFEGVNTMVRRYQAILVSFQKISATNSNQSNAAAGLYHKLLSGRFAISLCFIHKVLSIMSGLSQLMQETTIKWITISGEMLAIKKLLVELDCHEISESAAQLCSDIGITLDYEDPINDIRESEKDSRDLCESLKSSTVPFLLQELERRFSNSNVEILSAMDALDASNESYLGYSTLSPLADRFGSCLKIDSGLLKTECERAKIITTAGKYIRPNYTRIYSKSSRYQRPSL